MVVVALAIGGCSGDDDPGPDTTASTDTEGNSTLELEPETTTTTTPDDTALRELLISEAPEGYAPASDSVLDLEAAAASELDVEAERALLETRSFERGWERSWATDDADVVYVAVYDFGSAQDAGLYLEDGTQTLTARAATPFDVPDVEGARGFTTIDEDESGSFTAHAVAFTRDDRWFLVLAGSTDSGASPDLARQLARAQSERVAAAGG